MDGNGKQRARAMQDNPSPIASRPAYTKLAASILLASIVIGVALLASGGRNSTEVTSTITSTATVKTASANNTTVNVTVNQSSTDPNCAEYGSVGGGPQVCVCAWAGTAKMIGFNTELRVAISPSPMLGNVICLYATVTLEGPAPNQMIFTVTNSTDVVVYQTYCSSTGPTVGTCSTFWDTRKTYQGINATPGGYILFLSTVPNINQTMIQGVPFTLG